MTGELATPRAAEGGRPDGGQGGRNGLTAQGYRGRNGPGEQVEGGNIESVGHAVEAVRNGRLFGQAVHNRNEGGKSGAKRGEAQYQGNG